MASRTANGKTQRLHADRTAGGAGHHRAAAYDLHRSATGAFRAQLTGAMSSSKKIAFNKPLNAPEQAKA